MNFIVYIVFGPEKERLVRELECSIRSLERVINKNSKKKLNVLIYSESSISISYSREWPNLQYINLAPKIVNDWIYECNTQKLIVKIKILYEVISKFDSNVLLVDTDTFFVKDPIALFSAINRGKLVLHMKEYRVFALHGLQKYLKLTYQNTGNQDLSQLVNKNTFMWNSGTIGISSSGKNLISTACNLIKMINNDPDFPIEHQRVVEQTVISALFQSSGTICSSERVIIHYWFFKPFAKILVQVFNGQHSIIRTLYPDIEIKQLPRIMGSMYLTLNGMPKYLQHCMPKSSWIGRILRQCLKEDMV